jgi:hypothetical protein
MSDAPAIILCVNEPLRQAKRELFQCSPCYRQRISLRLPDQQQSAYPARPGHVKRGAKDKKSVGYGDDECNFHLMSRERAGELGFVPGPDAK